MALAALAAMTGWAGESAEFRLDTMDGTRTARSVETIAYSSLWNNGGAVSVAVDGAAIKEANAPATGDVVWNAAQATPGTHTLTHTCGGETLTAVFEVAQAAHSGGGSHFCAFSFVPRPPTFIIPTVYFSAGNHRYDSRRSSKWHSDDEAPVHIEIFHDSREVRCIWQQPDESEIW